MDVLFSVDDASIQETADYLEQTRMRILSAIREGMAEAMGGLAWTVADKLQGSPIVSRTGQLLGTVLGSPKVTETDSYIKGTVSSNDGKKPKGLWLEGGISDPSTLGMDTGLLYEFTASDGKSVFTHGHAAFQIAPKPFLNPSLEEYKPTILDIITSRIEGAVSV